MVVGSSRWWRWQRPAVVPLSFAQQRLWFIDQLQGPSAIYNMAVALRLAGRLDADALGAALADVVGRHESLRTLFVAPEGVPQQVVVPVERVDLGWQVVDASGWSEGRLGEAIESVSRYTFDLATEIPLRARLFRVAEDEHVLVAVVHHIAADGWSITPLVADIGVAYAARCAGQAPGWAPLPVQYVDYTLWQRAQLGDIDDPESRIAAQLAYWEQALARDARAAGVADRSALSAGGRLPRCLGGSGVVSGAAAAGRPGGPRAQRDHLHGGPGRAGGAAFQAQRQQRCGPRVRDRRARRSCARWPGRVLRQHPGAAGRCFRGSHGRGTAERGAPTQPGRLRAPGCALRGAGGAAQPPLGP